MDDLGRRLPHARLEIGSPLGREVAYSDQDGRFRVRLSTTESWPMTVRDSGFATVTTPVAATSYAPLMIVLERASGPKPPDVEQMTHRGCQCPRDLFTHNGR